MGLTVYRNGGSSISRAEHVTPVINLKILSHYLQQPVHTCIADKHSRTHCHCDHSRFFDPQLFLTLHSYAFCLMYETSLIDVDKILEKCTAKGLNNFLVRWSIHWSVDASSSQVDATVRWTLHLLSQHSEPQTTWTRPAFADILLFESAESKKWKMRIHTYCIWNLHHWQKPSGVNK